MAFPSPSDLGFRVAVGRRLEKWVAPLALVAVFVLGYPYLADLVRAPLLRLFPAEGLTLTQAITVVLGGPVALFLIILGHESGHALAGVGAGLRFEMIAAGPVLIRMVETERGRHFNASFHLEPAMLAGYSVCLPPGKMTRPELRRAMLWHISGGPGASLILGCLALGTAVLMPAAAGWESVMRALLLLMGLGSLLVGIATATPTHGRSLLNDGARWVQLVRGGAPADRDLTLLTTSAKAMVGDAPRAWDETHLRSAARMHDSSLFEFWALRYLWLHLWDCNETGDASAILQRALKVAAVQGRAVQVQAARDAARFSLWACDSPDLADEWLKHALAVKAREAPLPLTEDSEVAVARFFETRAAAGR